MVVPPSPEAGDRRTIPIGPMVTLGVVTILLWDGIGGTLARALGFSYAYVGLGAYIIYVLIGGVVVYRTESHFGNRWRRSWWARRRAWRGAVAGAIVGAVDAAVGWPLVALIGPVSVGEAYAVATATGRLENVVLLGVFGAVLGLLGGLGARWLRDR